MHPAKELLGKGNKTVAKTLERIIEAIGNYWCSIVRVCSKLVTKKCIFIIFIYMIFTRAIFFKVRSVAKLKPQSESHEAFADVLRNAYSMPVDRDT